MNGAAATIPAAGAWSLNCIVGDTSRVGGAVFKAGESKIAGVVMSSMRCIISTHERSAVGRDALLDGLDHFRLLLEESKFWDPADDERFYLTRRRCKETTKK